MAGVAVARAREWRLDLTHTDQLQQMKIKQVEKVKALGFLSL
jgi:hypothetical protein